MNETINTDTNGIETNGNKTTINLNGGGSAAVEIDGSRVRIVQNSDREPGTGRLLAKYNWPMIFEWYLNNPDGRPTIKRVSEKFQIPFATVVAKVHHDKWVVKWNKHRIGSGAAEISTNKKANDEMGERVRRGSKTILEATDMLAGKCMTMTMSIKGTAERGGFSDEEKKKYGLLLQTIGIALEKASAVYKNFGINLSKVPKLYGVSAENDDKTGTGSEELAIAVKTIKKEERELELDKEDTASEVEGVPTVAECEGEAKLELDKLEKGEE